MTMMHCLRKVLKDYHSELVLRLIYYFYFMSWKWIHDLKRFINALNLEVMFFWVCFNLVCISSCVFKSEEVGKLKVKFNISWKLRRKIFKNLICQAIVRALVSWTKVVMWDLIYKIIIFLWNFLVSYSGTVQNIHDVILKIFLYGT